MKKVGYPFSGWAAFCANALPVTARVLAAISSKPLLKSGLICDSCFIELVILPDFLSIMNYLAGLMLPLKTNLNECRY